MVRPTKPILQNTVQILNPAGASCVVLVCEHASHFMPPEFSNLGLTGDTLTSHIAWDPGARAVAERMSRALDAKLVVSCVSRLIYDCNRPPTAPDAMPEKSEDTVIPGNQNLSGRDKDSRCEKYYRPFQRALSGTVSQANHPVIITVHSFTPIYRDQHRAVEIGVLHDTDTRLADAMITSASRHTDLNVERNQPYGPTDGVTHTLTEHAIPGRHLNVMLEIRNDLIATVEQQDAVATSLAAWLLDACAQLGVAETVQCTQ